MLEKIDIVMLIKKSRRNNRAELYVNHMHMLPIPTEYSVLLIVVHFKGKSNLMIFDRYVKLKYKYGNRHFEIQKTQNNKRTPLKYD